MHYSFVIMHGSRMITQSPFFPLILRLCMIIQLKNIHACTMREPENTQFLSSELFTRDQCVQVVHACSRAIFRGQYYQSLV